MSKKQEELTRRQKLRARAKASSTKFKREMKKSTNTAIVAAFGFLIALSWRDLIKGHVETITGASPIQGQLIETIIITIIAVLGIMLATKFLSKK